jgi:hypothetical protein
MNLILDHETHSTSLMVALLPERIPPAPTRRRRRSSRFSRSCRPGLCSLGEKGRISQEKRTVIAFPISLSIVTGFLTRQTSKHRDFSTTNMPAIYDRHKYLTYPKNWAVFFMLPQELPSDSATCQSSRS